MTRPMPAARTPRADGDDLESLPWAEGAAAATNNGAKGVTHRRHRWVDGPSMGITFVTCVICGAFRDRAASRRGRSSLRAGKDAERAVAHRHMWLDGTGACLRCGSSRYQATRSAIENEAIRDILGVMRAEVVKRVYDDGECQGLLDAIDRLLPPLQATRR